MQITFIDSEIFTSHNIYNAEDLNNDDSCKSENRLFLRDRIEDGRAAPHTIVTPKAWMYPVK